MSVLVNKLPIVQRLKVAEHWDDITPFAKPNPSGRTLLDGTTEVTDLDKTVENKAMITDIIDTVLIGGETPPPPGVHPFCRGDRMGEAGILMKCSFALLASGRICGEP